MGPLLNVFLIFPFIQIALSISKTANTMSAAKICSLPPNPGFGDCSSRPVTMFYFDAYELRCKKFLFLNCKERNANRFATEEECESVCLYTGGVCPENSVSFASPNKLLPIHCSHSSVTDQCPMDFICTRKERSGHCCRPEKDYCPLGQLPLIDTRSRRPMKCNPMHTHRTCSDGYECIAPYRGNPWGFCCSTKIEGRCPNGSHVYLYPENGEPQKCTVGVTTCRIGYTCQSQTNSIVGFCCNTTSLNDEKDSGARNETLPLKNTTEFLIANEGLVSKGNSPDAC
ncbi:Kunitz/Bovine pancreatic trypsin inhibitor domain protein [Necator americanus]|uniref:Kunitz/Bovine pancreatic trypsin inhibitor domain protein n=1 Tax=Necator americanus TaxID=51031 RepID=W2SLP4_NECAM|nr:Kunitz/Bovine pancreatic trypsin inhibitor domain protein [Necator americanus]ETN70468.1 Kunitz/Bovine pancreatic trypsin inhibitor domain protein [Necator americanus]